MTRDITPGEVEWAGAMEIRFFDVDITNYDETADNNGESFTPAEAGMSRFQYVHTAVDVSGGTASSVVDCVANYDYTNQNIHLFYAGTDGSSLSEVSSNSNEGALVKVMAVGR